MSVAAPSPAARQGAWRGPLRASAWALACLLLGGALAYLAGLDHWLDRRHDWQASALAPLAAANAARTVEVDEASLRRLGAWPLRREVYVPAGQWLLAQGARAVAFGLLLVDAREGDAAFTAWLQQPGQPVLLGARSLAGDGDVAPAQALPPGCRAPAWQAWQLPVWARPAPGGAVLPIQRVGVLSAPLDEDGVLRSVPLWQRAGDLALPAMPLALWRLLHPERAAALRCTTTQGWSGLISQAWLVAGEAGGRAGGGGDERAGEDGGGARGETGRWPVDAQHRMRPWLPSADSVPEALPLWRVVAAAQGQLPPAEAAELAAAVRGRVVFIGGSAPAAGEQVLTAQGWRHPAQALAASFDAFEQQRLLRPPHLGADLPLLAVLLLPWLAAAGLAWRGKSSPLAVLAAVLMATLVLMAVDWSLVAQAGQLTHLGWPLAALACMAGSTLWRWRQQAAQEQRQLKLARAEATAVARVKSEFLAQVSHEVRTPLNALLGAAELLQGTPLNAEQQRHVSLFSQAGHELLGMLNDLLDLSKSEAGLLKVQRQPFSLTQVVAEQLALFEGLAQQKGLTLDTDTHPDLPEVVLGDAQRVAQVLRNLLSNAVKFTPVGRVTLAIGFGRDSEHLRFEVRDTGIGVPAARLDELFAPYTQAHDGAGLRFGGTGLGLAIARRLVDLMGGQIGVQSREGLGSVFHVELPLPATAAAPRGAGALAQAGQAGQRAGLAGVTTGAAASGLALARATGAGADALGSRVGTGLRVLAADDSTLNLMLLRAFLEGAGYQVDTAIDGAAALRMFERQAYRVVLLDLRMPVMDGLAAVQAMRQFEQRRQRAVARILAVSGQVDAHEVAAALAAGFDAHLGKPYTRDQLLDVVAGMAATGWGDGLGADPAQAADAADAAHRASAANASRLDVMSRLPDSDLPAAVTRLGSAALYDRVLDAAREPLQQFEQRLADLLDQVPCDLDSAQRLAHNLKTLAATLGLPGLSADARRLEQALADTIAPADDPALRQARQRVSERLTAVREVLRVGAEPGPRRAAGGGL